MPGGPEGLQCARSEEGASEGLEQAGAAGGEEPPTLSFLPHGPFQPLLSSSMLARGLDSPGPRVAPTTPSMHPLPQH